MESSYVKIEGDDDEALEIELSETGELTLETLQAHFGPYAVALKYYNKETEAWRLLSIKKGMIKPANATVLHRVQYQG